MRLVRPFQSYRTVSDRRAQGGVEPGADLTNRIGIEQIRKRHANCWRCPASGRTVL